MRPASRIAPHCGRTWFANSCAALAVALPGFLEFTQPVVVRLPNQDDLKAGRAARRNGYRRIRYASPGICFAQRLDLASPILQGRQPRLEWVRSLRLFLSRSP